MENPQDITSITPSDYVGDLLAKQLKSAVDQNPSLLKDTMFDCQEEDKVKSNKAPTSKKIDISSTALLDPAFE